MSPTIEPITRDGSRMRTDSREDGGSTNRPPKGPLVEGGRLALYLGPGGNLKGFFFLFYFFSSLPSSHIHTPPKKITGSTTDLTVGGSSATNTPVASGPALQAHEKKKLKASPNDDDPVGRREESTLNPEPTLSILQDPDPSPCTQCSQVEPSSNIALSIAVAVATPPPPMRFARGSPPMSSLATTPSPSPPALSRRTLASSPFRPSTLAAKRNPNPMKKTRKN